MNFSRTREMIRKRHRHNIENESQSALEVFKTNHTREEEEVFGTLICCPSCDYQFRSQQYQPGIQSWRGLPAGVKFDPTDEQILEHLEAKKKKSDSNKLLHPLIDQFIPTLQGDDGICYTHPRNLPGVSKDGQIRHFFHRPSKAYTTGKRKRRKVQTDEEDGNETRWHKTGKTRPILCGGVVKGFKKILVLYTNYGRQKKPEKTNWVMHQYHLGINEDEKDGEFVASKVFFQKQPRQCGSSQNMINDSGGKAFNDIGTQNYGCDVSNTAADIMDYYNPTYISYSQRRETSFHKLGDEVGGTSFIRTDTVTRK